jgi:ligand-binding sensor domain-containing protein/signal transduction histidine kinase
MKRFERGVAVLLLFAGTLPAWPVQLPVQVFTVADGLPSDRINAILPDSRGYLWVATGDGVARFDGRAFASYDTRDGLSGPIVQAIAETRDGAYWVGTPEGFCRLAPGPGRRFVCVPLRDGDPAVGATAFLQRADGSLWIGSDDGLYVLDADAVRSGSVDRRPSQIELRHQHDPTVTSIVEDAQGSLWVGTWSALVHRPSSGPMRTLRVGAGAPGGIRAVNDLLLDGEGALWVATPRTVFRIRLPFAVAAAAGDENSLEQLARRPATTGVTAFAKPEALDPGSGYLLNDDARGVKLLSRDLCTIAEGGFHCTPNEQIVPGNKNLRLIARDARGNVWLGTESSGLVRYTPSGIESFGTADGLSDPRIRSIFEAADGSVHAIASEDVARWTGSGFLTVRPRLPASIEYTGWGWAHIHFQDREGAWWIPTGEGLARFPRLTSTADLGRVPPRRFYTTRDGLSSDDVFRVYEDRRGDLWIATLGGAVNLHRWERSTDTIHPQPLPAPCAAGWPMSFAEDAGGELWIGLWDGGVVRREEGGFRCFSSADGIPAGRVSYLAVDQRGRLWLATSAGGVGVIDDPTSPHPSVRAFTTREGLSSNRVLCLARDGRGRIYAGTPRGVDRIDPATGAIRHYTVADGLPSSEIVSAFGDRGGDVWFGALQGLARLRSLPDPPEAAVPVLINRIRIDGKDAPVSELGEVRVEGIEIGPGHRLLEIGFLGVTLAAGADLRYQYRVPGVSDDWSRPIADRSVYFSDLPSGRYRFEVRSVTPAGGSSSAPAVLSFRIRPPFWRTWWFLAAVALSLVGLAAAAHRARVARLIAVERMRTRIAMDLHDDVGSTLSQIALKSELAVSRLERGDGDPARALEDVSGKARSLVDAMSDIVWSVDPSRDTLSELVRRVRAFALDAETDGGPEVRLELPDGDREVSLDASVRRQVYLVFKESFTNALRHAAASRIEVSLSLQGGALRLVVADDGRGLRPPGGDVPTLGGRGLASVRERAAACGGTLDVESAAGAGTRVSLSVPL